MMKRFFLLSFLLFSFAASAQIWAMSLDEARRISRETNKFLIMEFKAIWCVPCERMKAEYWYNPKYKSTLDKFVIVTVDIDSNHDVARHYKVKELPNVKITDYKGEVYYELMGYYGTKDMENYLSGIPENPGDLYQNLDFENEKVPTDEELMLLSGSYQSLAQRSTNRTIKHEFINFSNNLFNALKHVRIRILLKNLTYQSRLTVFC